MRNPREMIEPV